MKPHLLGSLLVLTTASINAQEPPLTQWFQNSLLPGGSILKSVVVQTVPGALHRVESSDDLLSWTVEEEIYGLGHPLVIPFTVITPSTAEPPAPSPQGPMISLLARPSSDPAGGLVVFLMSQNGPGSIGTTVPLDPDPIWNQTHLAFLPFADQSFLLMVHPIPVAPPDHPDSRKLPRGQHLHRLRSPPSRDSPAAQRSNGAVPSTPTAPV